MSKPYLARVATISFKLIYILIYYIGLVNKFPRFFGLLLLQQFVCFLANFYIPFESPFSPLQPCCHRFLNRFNFTQYLDLRNGLPGRQKIAFSTPIKKFI